jgi:uncharacterized protein YbaP (TraB family)
MRMAGAISLTLAATIAASALHAEERGPVTRHALWKVDGGRSAVYLLGSIHVLRRQNYPLERPIEDAFEEARIVAFEIDLDEARAAHARAAVRDQRVPPDGTLRGQVSAKTYEAVVRYLEGASMPPTLLDDVSPPIAASALVQIEMQRLGFDPEWGVDAYYYRRARKYGKTVVPLETVPQQLDALGNLSDDASDELIEATLEDVAALRTMLRDLIRAWKGGEVDRLETLVNGAFYDKPHVYGPLLAERNTRWVPKIEALLAGDHPAIVIVGTGHLVGDASLVAMLQAKGYVVTQQ